LHSNETKKKTGRWGIIACYILALVCLSAAIYQVKLLLPLLKGGRRAEALVIGIDVGVKGGKKAIFQFFTETGRDVTSRDMFDMYIIRLHKGEHVTVVYDPSDTKIVTADLGLWTWQGPAIFFFGFAFLAALGISLQRLKLRRGKQ
jgi:hypothetical protein